MAAQDNRIGLLFPMILYVIRVLGAGIHKVVEKDVDRYLDKSRKSSIVSMM
jgi:hypothetical protein